MDAKTILNPKWWLLAFGVLFFLAGLSNYLPRINCSRDLCRHSIRRHGLITRM